MSSSACEDAHTALILSQAAQRMRSRHVHANLHCAHAYGHASRGLRGTGQTEASAAHALHITWAPDETSMRSILIPNPALAESTAATVDWNLEMATKFKESRNTTLRSSQRNQATQLVTCSRSCTRVQKHASHSVPYAPQWDPRRITLCTHACSYHPESR